jgi:ankyrin repeat protein
MIAAHNGNDRLVRLYLSEPFDADINTQLNKDKNCYRWCEDCNNKFGGTALWFACFNGHLDVVRILIKIGNADVNLPNNNYQTPLQAAISQRHLNIVIYLIEEANVIIDETRDLLVAIKTGCCDIVDYLLNKGCDPNTRLIDYGSLYETFFALNYAVQCNYSDMSIIDTILKHGGNPALTNDLGQTAFHIAVQYENEQSIRELLHHGFQHSHRDINNYTPLMLAIVLNKTNMINLFYEILPRQEYVDELMLLASHYALDRQSDFLEINAQAFIYFEQALALEQPSSNAVPDDIHEFLSECQTIDELAAIQNHPESMYIQGLLVYERLLPQRDEIHLLIPKLLGLYDFLSDLDLYDRCLSSLVYIYPMSLACKENLFHHWSATCLDHLETILGLVIIEEDIQNINNILQAFEWTFNRLGDIKKVRRLCMYAMYVSTNMYFYSFRIVQQDKH